MKISYDWLKDYLKIEKTPAELADDLSMFGHEVESIERADDDSILDFEITPNRGDCLSILGMAREIGALYNFDVQFPTLKIEDETSAKNIKVKVEDPKLCPRFSARIIDNIKIGPSPDWMVKRLKSMGFRSINNVVDVTNYVMLATGQPLHAFDYDKIKNGLFNIRLSKKDEEMATLDGVTRKLDDGIMIMEDGEKIFDLVGIMGGRESEVSDTTKTIVLVGSIFDPVLIRRASKHLGHQTDASYRYERGVDYDGNIYGIDLAAKIIKDLRSKVKIGKLIDQKKLEQEKCQISFDCERINRLLGTNLTCDEIKENLERLNFEISGCQALVPSYRMFDVKRWQDLAEEVARIFGYNNLPKNNLSAASAAKNKDFTGREMIKDQLVELGFTEVYSYSFADKKKLEVLGDDPNAQPQIAKPLSPETEYLRPNLLSSLLNAVAKNPWAPEVNIFEIEAVFSKDGEKWQLGLVTTGKSKNVLEKALQKLNLNLEIQELSQNVLDAFKIRRPVKYVLVDIEKIAFPAGDYSLKLTESKFRPISKFPPTVRDLAFIVDSSVNAAELQAEIIATGELILLAELFDEFSSGKFGQNKKNLAYHVWLQSMEGPLSDAKTNEIIDEIVKKIAEKFQAELRMAA